MPTMGPIMDFCSCSEWFTMVNMPPESKPRPTMRMGRRIRDAREGKKLSTQAAAASSRISPGYLFKLESGLVGTPSPRVLHRVGEVLDIGYWELMRLAGYVAPEGEDVGEVPPAQAHEEGEDMSEQPTNERIVELLEAIQAELADVRRAQAEVLEALRD
jgi:transcriptional regulator with XRE-family HTH domain